MSWQMYPMASRVDSFMCSVLLGAVTLATSCGISSGHWLTGISAQAMPATHWEAELGRYVSVPNVCSTWSGERGQTETEIRGWVEDDGKKVREKVREDGREANGEEKTGRKR